MNAKPLSDLRVLVMEDEFLIAMDVEQICRENGARDALIVRSLAELGSDPFSGTFDIAVVDVMLGGESTVDFAKGLLERGIPFVFATGYSHMEDIFSGFPDVRVISKPYGGDDLVAALAEARSNYRDQATTPDPIT